MYNVFTKMSGKMVWNYMPNMNKGFSSKVFLNVNGQVVGYSKHAKRVRKLWWYVKRTDKSDWMLSAWRNERFEDWHAKVQTAVGWEVSLK